MHSSSLAAAVTVLAVAAAAPALDANAALLTSGFEILQTQNPLYVGPNGLYSRLKALRKYGAHDEFEAVVKAANAEAGSVIAKPAQYDSQYLSPVKIGATNPKTLQLDFDTGSSDLWVFSNQMPLSEQEGHNIYNIASGKKIIGASWNIQYGDGSSAGGDVFRDTVNIGGATVTSQAVEAAQSAAAAFVYGPNDGLVGLAFSSINSVSPQKVKTFVDTAVQQGMKNVFASDLKYHAAGSYDFGKINSTKYTGSIHYAPVDSSQGFWMISPSAFSVGGKMQNSGSLRGIADTGTSLILADSSVLDAYYVQVPSARYSSFLGGIVFLCSEKLPDFGLTVAGYTATVPGKYINYATINSIWCYGGIQPNSGLPFSIYGDVFLKGQYVVFDRTQGSPRLGLAKGV